MSIIYIKYFHDSDKVKDLCDEIERVFSEYNWGGGFVTSNFRFDQSYFYCDLKSPIFTDTMSHIFLSNKSYIQGMISGYLLAQGVEIL